MSVTQEIKDRLDIVQYVLEYVPDLKKAGRYHKACCPFHGEKTPSFVVNADTQSWRCFGACAEGGDIFTFAQKINGWDFAEALRESKKLYTTLHDSDRMSDVLPILESKRKATKRLRKVTGFIWPF